jgi:hypothetical protein
MKCVKLSNSEARKMLIKEFKDVQIVDESILRPEICQNI